MWKHFHALYGGDKSKEIVQDNDSNVWSTSVIVLHCYNMPYNFSENRKKSLRDNTIIHPTLYNNKVVSFQYFIRIKYFSAKEDFFFISRNHRSSVFSPVEDIHSLRKSCRLVADENSRKGSNWIWKEGNICSVVW